MVILVTPALEELLPQWREAAEEPWGRRRGWQKWPHIALPVLAPALAGATLVLFGNAFAAYATALALTSGSIPLVPTAIASALSGNVLAGRQNVGLALGLTMVVVIAVVMVGYLMTAAENVAFGLRLRKVGKAERRRRAAELLELVGLGDRGGSYPHQLSGGQQQRVALARALAAAPSVLLLDEPLSALDARVRVQLRDEIRSLQLAEGITTLFVTHDQSEALAIADRVAVLNAGRLEQVAPPQEVYASPANAFVAAFVGVVNRLVAVPDGPGRVGVLGASAELDGDAKAGSVIVRPEALTVGGDGAGEPGTVVTRTFLGAVTRFVVATEAGEITVDAVTRPGLPDAGERTVVRRDADRVRAAT